jgi:hypothetical protein
LLLEIRQPSSIGFSQRLEGNPFGAFSISGKFNKRRSIMAKGKFTVKGVSGHKKSRKGGRKRSRKNGGKKAAK